MVENPQNQNQITTKPKKRPSCAVDMFFLAIIFAFGIVILYLLYNLLK